MTKTYDKTPQIDFKVHTKAELESYAAELSRQYVAMNTDGRLHWIDQFGEYHISAYQTGILSIDPTVNDDIDAGYYPNSTVVNSSTPSAWICVDATAGAAVWVEVVDIGNAVQKSTFNANTILKADTDDTPVALAIPSSKLIGRTASSSIAALSGSDVGDIIGTSDNLNEGSANLFLTTTERAEIADAFLKSTDDSDDITEGSINLFATTTEKAFWNNQTLDGVTKNNNILSRKLDASSGYMTGINAAALKNDAINRLALQRATMPLLPVISEVDTLPASPDPGDRHLLSSAATAHAGEIAQAVPDSLDYTTWESGDTTGFDNTYTDIIRAPEWNLWIACARTGTGNRIVYSRDCGQTWSACSAPDSAWESLAFAPEISTACAVGDSGAVAITTDGINWTAQTGSNANNHRGVCWASGFGTSHGRFVVISASGTGNRAMYSPTGLTSSWVDGTTPADETFNSLCFSPELSQVCAFAYTGTNRVISTTDGATWTLQSSTATNTGTWYGSVWASGFNNGSGAYFAVSSSSGDDNILTSSDGVSFTTLSSGTNTEMKAICYAPQIETGMVAIACSSGTLNRIITTTDAVTFDHRTTPDSISYDAIAWGEDVGCFTAVSSTGTANRVMTSAVDTRWMYEPLQEGQSVFNQARMAMCTMDNNGTIQREMQWQYEFEQTLLNACENPTENVTSKTGLIVNGEVIILRVEATATINGTSYHYSGILYDAVAYDDDSTDPHLDEKQNTIIGNYNIDGVNVLASTGASGSIILSFVFSTASSAGMSSEVTARWTFKVTGRWHSGVGAYV